MAVQVTTGKPTPTPPVMEVRGSPATEGLNLTVKGVRFEATLTTDTNHDYDPGDAVELQGVIFEAKDFSDGDHISLQIVQSGEPDVVVATYADTVYVKPSGECRVVADGTAQIPAGLKIRAVYHSVATDGPKPAVYLDYLIWK